VALFKDLVPVSFGRFNLAFISMFRIAAGETWVDGLPLIDELGDLHWKSAIFVCSYLVINVWVVLQVHDQRIVQHLPVTTCLSHPDRTSFQLTFATTQM
jgi:hypothetical protein